MTIRKKTKYYPYYDQVISSGVPIVSERSVVIDGLIRTEVKYLDGDEEKTIIAKKLYLRSMELYCGKHRKIREK